MKKSQRNLREENRRLLRENAYLRHRLASLGEKIGKDAETPFADRFFSAARMAASMHRRSYIAYLFGRLRESLFFRLWDRTRFAVRGFFFVSKLWSLTVWIVAILGFGTQFVLFVGMMAVILPALSVLAVVIGAASFFGYRRRRREIRHALASMAVRRVYIVFAGRASCERPYFAAMLRDLEKDGVVFLVTRSWMDTRFRGMCRLRERCVLIHISFYFSLRGNTEAERVVYIY